MSESDVNRIISVWVILCAAGLLYLSWVAFEC